MSDRQSAIDALHREVFGAPPTTNGNGSRPAEPVDLDDQALLDRAMRATNGVKFRTLWAGDTSGYSSASEADAALALLLAFWTGRDVARMDQLFRLSGLMREKWDSRRGESTYGGQTIARAVERCEETYQQRREQASEPTTAAAARAWRRLSEVTMESIRYVDRPYLQRGALHLLAGRKGQGKGTLLAHYTARITRGELGDPRHVLWIASEDSARIDIRPRVLAAGGDDTCVILPDVWPRFPSALPGLSALIDDVQAQCGPLAAIWLDPIANHLDAGLSSNSEADVRAAIAPLNDLADQHDLVIIAVRHLSEKECAHGVLAAILGSSAWVQTPRVVIAVASDDEDGQIRHMQVVGGNRARTHGEARAFRIDGVRLDGLDEEVTRLTGLDGPGKSVERVLSAAHTPAEGASSAKTTEARELILDILDAEGQQESDALDARVAEATGLAAKSIRNARGALARQGLIRAQKGGLSGAWYVSRTLAPRPEQPA
jgi:hypothetical protein